MCSLFLYHTTWTLDVKKKLVNVKLVGTFGKLYKCAGSAPALPLIAEL